MKIKKRSPSAREKEGEWWWWVGGREKERRREKQQGKILTIKVPVSPVRSA